MPNWLRWCSCTGRPRVLWSGARGCGELEGGGCACSRGRPPRRGAAGGIVMRVLGSGVVEVEGVWREGVKGVC